MKEYAYACSRSFIFNSYRTRIFVCSIAVRRDIISVLDAGTDSSGDVEGVAVIEVGELGAEPGVGCRVSEERALIMFAAFLSVVRKSSPIGIVRGCDKTRADALTFAKRILPLQCPPSHCWRTPLSCQCIRIWGEGQHEGKIPLGEPSQVSISFAIASIFFRAVFSSDWTSLRRISCIRHSHSARTSDDIQRRDRHPDPY